MHIYAVFREEDGTPYGVLCGRGTETGPALYGNEEAAVDWAIYLRSRYPHRSYAVYKFNLNPNGFTAERVY